MAKQEENSLPCPRFFKLFLPQLIDNSRTQFKLPSSFVKEHGNSLSECAYLQVPTGGLTWKAELLKCGRRVWLHKGWEDFVEYYSIKDCYFLMFRYEGESRFRVFIFDTTTMEIQYPVGSASTSRERVKLDQSKVIKIEEEDRNDDDDDRCPRKLHKGKQVARSSQSSKLKAAHSPKVLDKVLKEAKAFESPNPCFIVTMRPTHVSHTQSALNISLSHVRSHFRERENNGMYLKLKEDGRAWFVKYGNETPWKNQVRLQTSGWSIFMKDNHLQVGDVCVFELIDSNTLTYKVTIFRVADYYA